GAVQHERPARLEGAEHVAEVGRGGGVEAGAEGGHPAGVGDGPADGRVGGEAVGVGAAGAGGGGGGVGGGAGGRGGGGGGARGGAPNSTRATRSLKSASPPPNMSSNAKSVCDSQRRWSKPSGLAAGKEKNTNGRPPPLSSGLRASATSVVVPTTRYRPKNPPPGRSAVATAPAPWPLANRTRRDALVRAARAYPGSPGLRVPMRPLASSTTNRPSSLSKSASRISQVKVAGTV